MSWKKCFTLCLVVMNVLNATTEIDSHIVNVSPYSPNIATIASKILQWLNEEKTFSDYVTFTLDSVFIQLNELQHNKNETSIILNILQNTPNKFSLFKELLVDIINIQANIDIEYTAMENYIIKWNGNHSAAMKTFCKNLASINNNNSITYKMNIIYKYFVPTENESRNSPLINTLITFPEEVNTQLMYALLQSPQQIIYNFYKSIVITQLKSFILNHFACKTLQELGDGSYEEELKNIERKYAENIKNLLRVFNLAMTQASCELWRNNTSEHIEGETYEDIYGLAQARILNIKDLNKGECDKKCEEFNELTSVDCLGDKSCEERRCKMALNCYTISRRNFEICYGEQKRKYNYIQSGNDIWGNRNKNCSKKSYIKKSFSEYFCSYCICTCLKTSDFLQRPEIYINLRSVVANVAENRVVTGVRFVKYSRVIHLQIQEGTLLPYGNVKNVEWVPIEAYNLSDHVLRGQDYHRLSWNSRAFDFNVLYTPDEHVVTGLRFTIVREHITLEILTNGIDYQSGKLTLPFNRDRFRNNAEPARTEIKLFEPDVSILGSNYSPNFKANQFIHFQLTDLKKDVAQTILPYFDCQPVYSSVPAPLQGIGLFYKEQIGYGGFIVPKIITYDFTSKIVEAFTVQNYSSIIYSPTSTIVPSYVNLSYFSTEKASNNVEPLPTEPTAINKPITTTSKENISSNVRTTSVTTQTILQQNNLNIVLYILVLVILVTLILVSLYLIVGFFLKIYPFDDVTLTNNESIELVQSENSDYTKGKPILVKDYPIYVGTEVHNKIAQDYKEIVRNPCKNTCADFKGENDIFDSTCVNGYNNAKIWITIPPNTRYRAKFWWLIWKEDIKIIVILNEVCDSYWPKEDGRKESYGKISVESMESNIMNGYIKQKLKITRGNKVKIMYHFWYLKWFQNLQCFDYLVELLKDLMSIDECFSMLIQCGYNYERTSVVILSILTLRMAKSKNEIDFFRIANDLKIKNNLLVSKLEQYILAHLLVLGYLIDEDFALPLDENFDKEVRDVLHKTSVKPMLNTLDQVNMIRRILMDYYNFPIYNKISISSSRRSFITQPQPNCKKSIKVLQFWNYVLNLNIKLIVTLNHVFDANSGKCVTNFWPNLLYEKLYLNNIVVQTLGITENEFYMSVELKVTSGNIINKLVNLICLKHWMPKRSKPQYPMGLLYVWNEMTTKLRPNVKDVLVTCYDGVTASGLFIALSFVIDKMKAENVCDVFSVIKQLRLYKPSFMEGWVFSELLYKLAIEYLITYTEKQYQYCGIER